MKKNLKKVIWTFSAFVVMFNSAFCAKWNNLTTVQKIGIVLEAADWGIRADHDFCNNKCWISDDKMAQFQKWENIAKEALAENPNTPITAVLAVTNSWEKSLAPDDKLRPYVDAFKAGVANI